MHSGLKASSRPKPTLLSDNECGKLENGYRRWQPTKGVLSIVSSNHVSEGRSAAAAHNYVVAQNAPTPGGDYQSGAGLGDSRKVGLNASEETHPPSEPAVTMREGTKGALT